MRTRGGMSLANVLLAALAALSIWQLTAGVAQAAFPGTNGKLAFSSPRSGFPTESNIFTMGADGSAQTRITSFNGDELYPAWSPDGARMAFQQDPGLHPEIWTSKADGTDLRRLTNNSADDLHPAWSPDGTKIVFASDRQAPTGISRPVRDERRDGSGAVNITNTPTIDEDYPSWSPDGTKIAFSRDGDIATVAPNGTGLSADRHRAHRDRAGLVAQQRPARVPHRHQLRRRDLQDERQRSGVTNLTNTGPAWRSGRCGPRRATGSPS